MDQDVLFVIHATIILRAYCAIVVEGKLTLHAYRVMGRDYLHVKHVLVKVICSSDAPQVGFGQRLVENVGGKAEMAAVHVVDRASNFALIVMDTDIFAVTDVEEYLPCVRNVAVQVNMSYLLAISNQKMNIQLME